MRLEVTDYKSESEWRWILYNSKGKYLADHEVSLDISSPEYRGFRDIAEYLDYYEPITKAELQLEELGEWIGIHVFGALRRTFLTEHQPPVTAINVLVPLKAQQLLFRPLELAQFDDGRSFVEMGIRFIYQLQSESTPRRPKEETKRSLRILSVFSLPEDTNPLNLRRERHELQILVRRLQRTRNASIDLRVLQYGATRATLRDAIEEAEGWDLIHIAGHGHRGELLLEDENGHGDKVSSDDLSDLIEVTKSRIKFLILDACYSGAATHADARAAVGLERLPARHETREVTRAPKDEIIPTELPSLAQELAQRLDCAVLAMRYPVGDVFATDLMLALCERLLEKRQPLPLALQLALKAALHSDRSKPALSAITPILFGPSAATLTLAPPIRHRKVRLSRQGLIAFPPEPERFVGRQQQMLRASQALAPGSEYRAIIFHGMPGSGKTSAALELTHRHSTRRFTGYVWYKAPEHDLDISTALTDFLLAVESQLDEPDLGLLAYLDNPEKFKRFTLPRFRKMLEEYSILFVLDDVDGLLTQSREWRDPLWHNVIEALLDHNGLSRLVMTAHVIPTQLTKHESVRRESIHTLSFAESVLLAREMPNLGKLFVTADGRGLLQRILHLVQGHPKLLEMADGLAKEPESLLQHLKEMEAAAFADSGELGAGPEGASSYERLGEAQQPERVFVRMLRLWTKRLAVRLSDGTKLFLSFLVCLENRDRSLNVVGAVWPIFLEEIRTSLPMLSEAARTPFTVLQDSIVELEGNSLVTTLKYTDDTSPAKPPITYVSIHPVIEETARGIVVKGVSDVVDREMGNFWIGGYKYVEAFEMYGGTTTVVNMSMRAVPYLLRSKRWVELSRTLERIVQRDETPATLQSLIPLLQKIIKETGRPNTRGILAVTLRKLHRLDEAEYIERARIKECVSRQDYRSAFVAAGHLMDMLVHSGRHEEASQLLEDLREYKKIAELGQEFDINLKLRELDLRLSMGESEEAIGELEKLADEVKGTPVSEVGVLAWNVYEVLLSRAIDYAAEQSQWKKAHAFSEELTSQQESRSAGALEIARSRMKAFRPLLELKQHDSARSILQDCRRAFTEANALFDLVRVYSSLAELESRVDNLAAAVRFQELALRYSYQTESMDESALSHYQLARFLVRTGGDRKIVVAHAVAAIMHSLDKAQTVSESAIKIIATSNVDPLPPSFEQVVKGVEQIRGVRFRELHQKPYGVGENWQNLMAEIWTDAMRAAVEIWDELLKDFAFMYFEGDEERILAFANAFREVAAESGALLPEPIEHILAGDADLASLMEAAEGLHAAIYQRFDRWLLAWQIRMALEKSPGVVIARLDIAALTSTFARVACGESDKGQFNEAFWKVLEEAGYVIRESVELFWEGERDVQTLINGLDIPNQRLIQRISHLVDDDEHMMADDQPSFIYEVIVGKTFADAIAAVAADNTHEIRAKMDEFLAMFPEIHQRLADAIQRILDGEREVTSLVNRLNADDAELVHKTLQKLSGDARQPESIDAPTFLILNVEQLIQEVVQTASGEAIQESFSEQYMFALQGVGVQLYEPIKRIRMGERNLEELTRGLTELDAALIHQILEQIEAQDLKAKWQNVSHSFNGLDTNL